jgi:hypothetical protein
MEVEHQGLVGESHARRLPPTNPWYPGSVQLVLYNWFRSAGSVQLVLFNWFAGLESIWQCAIVYIASSNQSQCANVC